MERLSSRIPSHQTGSGYPLAFTALISVAHFNVGQQQLEATKAIAYRAIENTCLSSAYGVGMPVQMAVVTEAGIEEINDGEPKHIELSDLIDLWKAKEVETLGALKPVLAIDDQTDGPAAEPSLDEAEIDAPGPAETPAP